MPPPSKQIDQRYSVTDWDENETPSNNLWVGNLASNVTDADLLTLFQKHGAIDSVTLYSTRCYAFVHFKRVEDAKAAREAIRGKVLRGNAMKIEFAKPAKPCKSLWVGGIGPSVSKEALEGHFVKFGKIEDLKFLRDRNTAFIDYFRLEDATQALKSMNGKRIGDGQIRVDFLRSQPSKREQLPDFRDAREGQFFNRSMGPIDTPWMPHGFKMNYSEPTHQIPNRQQHLQSLGGRKWDGQPSNVLCISYPPPLHIDEQMLHNAMILFGEIEMIRSFPSRHCSFVEFRSMDEARCAKDGLQGKLFNDPRISITYASNELAPNNDYHGFYPGINGPRPRPRPDIFINDAPFRPPQMDMFSHDHSIVPNSFPGYIPPRGIPRPDILMRPPLGPKSSFEPLLPGPEFSDSANHRVIHEMKPNTPMSGPNWRRTSLAPEILSPPPRMERFTRPMPDTGDPYDSNQAQRESKRSRTDGALPAMGPSYSLKQMDEQGLDQLYGRGPQFDGGVLGPLANVQGKNRTSSAGTGFTTGGTAQGHPELDYEWRGLIAKGGTPVCRSRCVPIGEGIGSTIPEVVNCSARTGLDMLTKHYVDAVGFNIIFFLPDTEEDFAPYTEFLRYLGAKNRAGVAKLDDGTTLFLVPPSDFLTKVLNIKGPERLYGVVLKFPQHASSSSTLRPTPQSVQVQPQNVDSCNIPSFPSQPDYNFQYQKTEYNSMPPQEDRVVQTVNEMEVSHVDSNLMLPATNTAAPISQAGLTLTPELIATLASLLPAKEKSLDTQLSSGSTAATFDRSQWTHEHNKSPEQTQTGHPQQQLGSQFNHHTQLVHHQQQQQQAYMTISHTPHDFVQGTDNTQIQDPAFNMPQQDVASFRPSNNFASPSPSGPFAVSLQVNQQYNYELPQDTWNGYEVHGPDSSDQYSASVLQPTTNPVPSSNQVQGHNIPLSHSVMPVTAENSNVGIPNQEQQLQSALYGGGQGALEIDKNERYRSTLQFAANLLLQIQQQPSGTQAGQGSGGH